MSYRVMLKATKSVTNGDGSLRYDVGDLLPEGHRDRDSQPGVFVPTVFEVVKGGLVDVSERRTPFVSNDTVLGPRQVPGETDTHDQWVTVGGKTAKQPGAPDDELAEPVSDTPKGLETPEPPTAPETPREHAKAVKAQTRTEPVSGARQDTVEPASAKKPQPATHTPTLSDGGNAQEAGVNPPKGHHS